MPRTLGVLGATTLTLALLVPASAQAETWGSSDPSGDVRGVRYDPDPAPCGTETDLDATDETNVDITGLQVRHTRRSVAVTTRFRDLVAEHEHNLDFGFSTPRRSFGLLLFRTDPRSGRWATDSVFFTQPFFAHSPGGCGGYGIVISGIRCGIETRFDFVHDLVRLDLPRACFGNPRWVRVGVRASFSSEDGRSEEYYSDEWGHSAADANPFLPPLGSRVATPRGARIGGHIPDGGIHRSRYVLARGQEG